MTFRIVQITDIHLTEIPDTALYGVDTTLSLANILSAVKKLPKQPELIVATGDLVENGSKASYTRLRNILEGYGFPVYTLPGNHDDLTNMKQVFNGDNISCVDFVAIGHWRCLFVNSQVWQQSHGYISDEEMSKLQHLLSEYKDHPVLVALHHTPSKVCPSFGCQLENAETLTQLLNQHPNVKAVIAGHTHTETEENAGNHMQYTTPSTFAHVRHAQAGEPVDHDDFWSAHQLNGQLQGYRVLDLHADGKIDSEVHWV
ncbi:MAG: metallophosphoesterase [Pseudomonadota bacterium]